MTTITSYRDAVDAVRKTPFALEHVPDALKTPELCTAAVEGHAWALAWVPDRLLTRDLCLAAVRQDGLAVRFVPVNMLTVEICWEAVRENPVAVRLLPEGVAHPEVCFKAFRQDRAWLDTHAGGGADAVRARLAELGVTEQDIEDAVKWGRGGVHEADQD